MQFPSKRPVATQRQNQMYNKKRVQDCHLTTLTFAMRLQHVRYNKYDMDKSLLAMFVYERCALNNKQQTLERTKNTPNVNHAQAASKQTTSNMHKRFARATCAFSFNTERWFCLLRRHHLTQPIQHKHLHTHQPKIATIVSAATHFEIESNTNVSSQQYSLDTVHHT